MPSGASPDAVQCAGHQTHARLLPVRAYASRNSVPRAFQNNLEAAGAAMLPSSGRYQPASLGLLSRIVSKLFTTAWTNLALSPLVAAAGHADYFGHTAVADLRMPPAQRLRSEQQQAANQTATNDVLGLIAALSAWAMLTTGVSNCSQELPQISRPLLQLLLLQVGLGKPAC